MGEYTWLSLEVHAETAFGETVHVSSSALMIDQEVPSETIPLGLLPLFLPSSPIFLTTAESCRQLAAFPRYRHWRALYFVPL